MPKLESCYRNGAWEALGELNAHRILWSNLAVFAAWSLLEEKAGWGWTG